MLLENQDLYRLHQEEQSVPLKLKVFSFQQRFNTKKHRVRQNHSSLAYLQPESQEEMQKNHFALRPKLPSKKLFEQPRFFMSLERKRVRIIDGLKNVSRFDQQSTTTSLKGKKLKHHQGNQAKHQPQSSQQNFFCDQKSNLGWQPKVKTPFLNYNMQYLIKKRKLMTPTPQSGHETISFLIRSKN